MARMPDWIAVPTFLANCWTFRHSAFSGIWKRWFSGDAANAVSPPAEALGLRFIFLARLTQKVQTLCRHDNVHRQTTEVAGLTVRRRYNGRADLENRSKEPGEQFGIKRLCVERFWRTETMHHLAIAAYNRCVLLQRRLGQWEQCDLITLRWAALWPRGHVEPGAQQAHLGVRGARQTRLQLVAPHPRKIRRPAQLPCR